VKNALAYYTAGVVAVNLKVVGLTPDKVSRIFLQVSRIFLRNEIRRRLRRGEKKIEPNVFFEWLR
jgi:hypothetical protein